MGYSGRYHAASLVAVLVALAVGILIGIGLADDVVSTASEELRTSLQSDLAAAGDERDELESRLEREGEFASVAVPALLAGRLSGDEVAVLAFGEVPDDSVSDVERSVEAAGGDLAAVARVEEPPDIRALSAEITPRARIQADDAAAVRALGERIGAELISAEGPSEALKETLFGGFNGSLVGVDRVTFLSAPTPEEEDEDPERQQGRATADALEAGIVSGVADRALGVVAAERTDTDPSTLGPYIDAGIPTVDHLDLAAGKVSLVLALAGERGNYGVKEEASTYMPDLLDPDAGP